MSLTEMLDEFPKKRILVIGDVMLDKYSHCSVRRISPEAPIQIAEVQKEEYVPGGAGNSANNLSSLGSKVYIAGIIGKDIFGKLTKEELAKRKIKTEGLIEDKDRSTTLKQRIVAHGQQLLRMDYETREEIPQKIEEKLIKYITKKINKIDGIIISDYAKGSVTKELVKKTIELSKPYKIPIVIDTKPQHKDYYRNATVITPNEPEARSMTGMEKEPINKVGKKLVKELNTTVLITRGEKGMSLFKKDGTIKHFPTVAKEVYDVSGAGDTAAATLLLAMTSGSKIEEAVGLANIAAGIVVGKIGTATTTREELENAIKQQG